MGCCLSENDCMARCKRALQGEENTEQKREKLERARTKWKTTGRPSTDRDKRAFPLLPAPRTWLINHLYAINHQTSSERLTRSIRMPLYLRKRKIPRQSSVMNAAHKRTKRRKALGMHRIHTLTHTHCNIGIIFSIWSEFFYMPRHRC